MRRRTSLPITTFYEEMPRTAALDTTPYVCDLCGEQGEGAPAGKGLMLWWRGPELRIEEPPLCEECARRITIGAVVKWALEDEEEG